MPKKELKAKKKENPRGEPPEEVELAIEQEIPAEAAAEEEEEW